MRYTVTITGPCRKYRMLTATISSSAGRVGVVHRRSEPALVRAALELVAQQPRPYVIHVNRTWRE